MLLKPKNLFILFIIACLQANAQTTTIDSLRAVITSTTVQPQKKLEAYVSLSSKISLVSFNETIRVAEEGLLLAAQLKDSLAIAELNRNIGIASYFKGDYEKAATQYYSAIGIYERKNKNKELANVYNDLAKLYRKTRDLKRALTNYNSSYALYKSLNDSSGMQMILNESGVVYEYQGNYEEALNHYRASLKIAQALNDEMGKSWCYNFIAGVYVLQQKFEQAENFNIQAMAIRQRLKDTFSLAVIFTDLGVMYSAWGKPERATYYFDQSVLLTEKMGYKELLSNNYAELAKLANMTGDYKKALDYFTWHTQLKDSLFNVQRTRQIEEIGTLYETNKREKQIELQQQTIKERNQLIIIITTIALLSLLVVYLLYNRNKLKQKAKLQEEILNQQELAAKAVLEAEEKERSRIAKDLHDGVGQMMSAARMNLSSFYNNTTVTDEEQKHSLFNIIQLVDESCKEVRLVSHSMMPVALNKNGIVQAIDELLAKINSKDLKTSFHSEGFHERLDSSTETILYRIIQECINNTIKHAEAKEIDLSMIKDADGISVTIEDNGKGFAYDATKMDDEDEGIGLKNIRSRIAFLKGTVDFDSAPGRGTLVAIHVPA